MVADILVLVLSEEAQLVTSLSSKSSRTTALKSPQVVNNPSLNLNLSIEVKVLEDVRKDDIRAEFKCEPLNYIYNMDYQKEFEPINRATGCVLESIIHSTRISLYRRLNTPELISKIDGLISLLKHYRRIIKKVYPNSVYSWIIDDIFNRLKLE